MALPREADRRAMASRNPEPLGLRVAITPLQITSVKNPQWLFHADRHHQIIKAARQKAAGNKVTLLSFNGYQGAHIKTSVPPGASLNRLLG